MALLTLLASRIEEIHKRHLNNGSSKRKAMGVHWSPALSYKFLFCSLSESPTDSPPLLKSASSHPSWRIRLSATSLEVSDLAEFSVLKAPPLHRRPVAFPIHIWSGCISRSPRSFDALLRDSFEKSRSPG